MWLAGPAPALGQWRQGIAWGRRPRAQSHLPNGLFQKARGRTKQLYTKYSVASPKGCTEFLALCSTECVPSVCSPAPQLSRTGQGGLALISPTPSLGRVQRKAWVWAFCSLYLSSPFEGWARPFLIFLILFFCQVPALQSPSSAPSPSLSGVSLLP